MNAIYAIGLAVTVDDVVKLVGCLDSAHLPDGVTIRPPVVRGDKAVFELYSAEPFKIGKMQSFAVGNGMPMPEYCPSRSTPEEK